MNEVRTHATIDIRDSVAPISLLMVENQLAAMGSGEVLKVLCYDTDTKKDLLKILKNSGHRCVKVEEAGDHFLLFVEKKPK